MDRAGTAAGRCHSSSGTRHSKDRLSAAQGQCRFEDAQPRYHVECPDMPNFEESPATVVTSYMHSPSKHTVEEYFDWIENFLALNASVIAFVDIPYHDRLEQLPSNARVIFVPTSLSSFRAMGCGLTLWKHENSRDCERKTHSPPLVSSHPDTSIDLSLTFQGCAVLLFTPYLCLDCFHYYALSIAILCQSIFELLGTMWPAPILCGSS